MLGRMVDKVDRLFVFDNTRREGPRLIALKIDGHVMLLEAGRIPEIDKVLMRAGQEE
jgi:predicted ABC-type ATPase